MADAKLSALTALTGPPAEDDLFYVSDTSAVLSKSMRTDELVKMMTGVARTYTENQTFGYGKLKLRNLGDTFSATLQSNQTTGNRTFFLPDTSGTQNIICDNIANIFTQANTFADVALDGRTTLSGGIGHGTLKLFDSNESHRITIQAGDESATRTLSIPVLGAAAEFVVTVAAQTITGAKTWAGVQVFNHGMFKLRDSGDDHSILIQSAGNNAADRTLSIPALAANDTIAVLALAQTFTAQQVFEVGAAGASPLVARQTGGVAGTDEVQVSHDGTNGRVQTKSGDLRLYHPEGNVCELWSGDAYTALFWRINGGNGALVFGTQASNISFMDKLGCVLPSNGGFFWYNAVSGYSGSTYLSATKGTGQDGILRITGGNSGDNGGGGQVELLQSTDVGTPATNSARLGAEDVAGTAELIASDEAGNETQLTPHAVDGPPELYAEMPGIEKCIRSINRFSNRVEFVNLTKLAKAVEALTGEKLTHSEDLASYNARTGRSKTPLDWDTVQDEKQSYYEKAMAEERAEIDRTHEFAVTAWAKKPVEERGEIPEKPAPKIEAKDIRKPKPEWLK